MFLRSKNFCRFVLKSYKTTLHPEKNTIIDSVTYSTILGFILNVKLGENLASVISTGDVYSNKIIIIGNNIVLHRLKFILTRE